MGAFRTICRHSISGSRCTARAAARRIGRLHLAESGHFAIRYTRNLMVRRLCALALAAVIVGAPVAAALCQLTCAAHDGEATTASTIAPPVAGHAHHQHPEPAALAATNGSRMTPGPQICGHPFEDAVGLQQTLQVLTAPALVSADVFSLAGPIARALFTHAHTVQHSPPGALALITQLRV